MNQRSEKNTPPHDGPLTEADWNFAVVPDDELVACCLWEYARESTSIALAAEYHQRCRRPESSSRSTERRLLGVKEFRLYRQLRDKMWETEFAYLGYYELLVQEVTDNAPPFLKLSTEQRRHLQAKVDETSVFEPLAAALVKDLERLWTANSVELSAIRKSRRSLDDDTEAGALYTPTYPISEEDDDPTANRTKTVALSVDFSRFTNKEIEAAFRRWLTEHRPLAWRKPDRFLPSAPRRGHKLNDYRVALDRLALMRLLHWFPPRRLQSKMPAAWRRYGGREADFRREIRSAESFFRHLFPFLPEDELPESHKRHGTWTRSAS